MAIAAVLAAAAIACSSSDAHVGCSPSLTCSYRPERLVPPEHDAGPPACTTECLAGEISAGGEHTCAVARAGELYCWGSNDEGQRGDHSPAADGGVGTDPRFPRVLERAAHVSAGGAHTCAIDLDGQVLCWGRNAEGQVDGTPSTTPIEAPVAIPGPTIAGATAISAGGAHTCALVPGGVMCWGSSRYGQVGRAVAPGGLAVGLVPGTTGAVEVSAGVRHTCARLADGHVVCWGELADGAGAMRARSDATPVPGLDDAIAIAAGGGHTCAIRAAAHDVVCWGDGASGQLGEGASTPSAMPVVVVDLPRVVHLAAGGAEHEGVLVGHTCAVDATFFPHCWGRGVEGQLGVGTATDAPRPVLVLDTPDEGMYLGDIVGVTAGGLHSCVLDQDGPILCWGDDASDQLGSETGGDPPTFGRASPVARFP